MDAPALFENNSKFKINKSFFRHSQIANIFAANCAFLYYLMLIATLHRRK